MVELSTGVKKKYQSGYFKHSQEKAINNTQQTGAILLLIAFTKLQLSKEKAKLEIKEIREFKKSLNLKMREHTGDYYFVE